MIIYVSDYPIDGFDYEQVTVYRKSEDRIILPRVIYSVESDGTVIETPQKDHYMERLIHLGCVNIKIDNDRNMYIYNQPNIKYEIKNFDIHTLLLMEVEVHLVREYFTHNDEDDIITVYVNYTRECEDWEYYD